MRNSMIWIVTLLFPVSLFAQETKEGAQNQPAPPPGALQPAEIPGAPLGGDDIKGPKGGTAFLLSLGATTAGVGAIVGSVFLLEGSDSIDDLGASAAFLTLGLSIITVGPSMGHMYAGATKHALIFSGLRAGSLGLVLGARGAQEVPLLVGSLGLVGLALYDLIDAPLAAKRVRKRAEKISLQISPAPIMAPDGSTPLGLMASGTF